MISRAAFLSFFSLGFAAAQKTAVTEVGGYSTFPGWPNRSYANGQCPVCGTRAPAYIREMRFDQMAEMRNCKSVGDYLVACDPLPKIPVGPNPQLIRCALCSAAFWQDAEKP
jgi:hypothetical protein